MNMENTELQQRQVDTRIPSEPLAEGASVEPPEDSFADLLLDFGEDEEWLRRIDGERFETDPEVANKMLQEAKATDEAKELLRYIDAKRTPEERAAITNNLERISKNWETIAAKNKEVIGTALAEIENAATPEAALAAFQEAAHTHRTKSTVVTLDALSPEARALVFKGLMEGFKEDIA